MNIKRIISLISGILAAVSIMSAQSYFDDDIYYDATKASKPAKVQSTDGQNNRKSAVIVYDYPSADNYTVNGTRSISVDDYNRRGIFATDSLTADTTATDFAYTRRIEQFYNPQIVSGSGDDELANIYYMEPDQVNIYVNTPSAYWGYDYFYPYPAWTSPYWYNNYWRWNSAWYWGSWYDPYWAWGPGWVYPGMAYPGWIPSWGYPGWGHPGWGPSWGWAHPHNPRHPGALGHRPTNGVNGNFGTRPSAGTGNRHYGNNGYRPSSNNGYRPGTGSNNGRRPSVGTGNNSYNRPSNNNNNGYNHPSNTNGGRYGTGSYNNGGGSRGGFGSGYGGGRSSGGRSTGGGGRGRH